MPKVIINSQQAKDYSLKLLTDCDINDDLQFGLDKFVLSRTAAQNRLYWQILTDMQNTNINEHAGHTKEEHHFEMKKEFLVTIFERDKPEYAEMVESLREVYRHGMKSRAIDMKNYLVKLTSTRDAKPDQFSEYLTCIMDWCNKRGIAYRLPGDLHNKAMGII